MPYPAAWPSVFEVNIPTILCLSGRYARPQFGAARSVTIVLTSAAILSQPGSREYQVRRTRRTREHLQAVFDPLPSVQIPPRTKTPAERSGKFSSSNELRSRPRVDFEPLSSRILPLWKSVTTIMIPCPHANSQANSACPFRPLFRPFPPCSTAPACGCSRHWNCLFWGLPIDTKQLMCFPVKIEHWE